MKHKQLYHLDSLRTEAQYEYYLSSILESYVFYKLGFLNFKLALVNPKYL